MNHFNLTLIILSSILTFQLVRLMGLYLEASVFALSFLCIGICSGDLFNFRFDSTLVNSSYDKGELITVHT